MGTWTQKSLQHPSHSDFLWDSKCGSENLLCDQRPGFKSLSNLLVALEMDMCACHASHFSRVRLFVTPWTVACQAPLFMESSRQEYWSGLPGPPPGD